MPGSRGDNVQIPQRAVEENVPDGSPHEKGGKPFFFEIFQNFQTLPKEVPCFGEGNSHIHGHILSEGLNSGGFSRLNFSGVPRRFRFFPFWTCFVEEEEKVFSIISDDVGKRNFFEKDPENGGCFLKKVVLPFGDILCMLPGIFGEIGAENRSLSGNVRERMLMMSHKDLLFTMKPLGYIHSPYTEREKAPRQSVHAEALPGKIVILPEYAPALLGLEGYSHVMVFFCFHRMEEEPELVHRPRGNGELRGLFATRTPRRPNRIGFSVLPLERIEENVLYVNQVDMLDGTPVLDIKAYEPGLLPLPEVVHTPER